MLWYSLEAPQRHTSNEYPELMFFEEIGKIISWYPLLSGAINKE